MNEQVKTVRIATYSIISADAPDSRAAAVPGKTDNKWKLDVRPIVRIPQTSPVWNMIGRIERVADGRSLIR